MLAPSSGGVIMRLAVYIDGFNFYNFAEFEISRAKIQQCLLPKTVVAGGKTITRPSEYDPPERV